MSILKLLNVFFDDVILNKFYPKEDTLDKSNNHPRIPVEVDNT